MKTDEVIDVWVTNEQLLKMTPEETWAFFLPHMKLRAEEYSPRDMEATREIDVQEPGE